MDERIITYERMDGVDASHGQKFELEITTLAYLRCQRLHEQWKQTRISGIKSFSLANNVKDAGKFDDIIISVEYVVNSQIENKIIFIQCKHIDEPSKNSKKRFQSYLMDNKSLKQFFESFEKIEQIREQVMDELVSKEPTNKKQKLGIKPEAHTKNLSSFFDCKDADTEFLFYSNIEIESDYELGMYKLGTQSSNDKDIANFVINTANTAPFELRLNEAKVPPTIFVNVTEKNSYRRTQFYEKFRVFVNQFEPETLINQELQLITNTKEDIEYLRALTIDEIRNHFTTKNTCTTLTEKNDTISNVRKFMMIRKKGTAIIDNFCKEFGMQKMFSFEAMSKFDKQLEHKKHIHIETNFLKLERIKVKQFFYSLPIEYTRIFLHDEEDSGEWISARETASYYNSKKVYICVQNDINLKIDTIKTNETLIQLSESSEQHQTISEYLDQLTTDTQNFILKTNLCFQGVKIDINSLCGDRWKFFFDQNTICNILENKLLQLHKPIPDLGFYVDRKFKIETLNLNHTKNNTEAWKFINGGIILFSENEKCIPEHDASFKVFKCMQDVRNFIKKLIRNQVDTYHVCSHCNGELELIYSFGKQSPLTINNVISEASLLNDKCSKIKIISGVAGIGKTTTMLSLAKFDKQNNPSNWVIFIELNMYLQQLKRIIALPSTDSAINFVGSTLLELKEIEFSLFAYACTESGKIAIYFDAFDEISPDAEKALLFLLLALERTKINKIFVSSRPNYVQVLEETILQKSVMFEGLTTVEKENALEGYWKQMFAQNDLEFDEFLLKETVQKVVKELDSEQNILNDISAIPLQIRMIANIYYESLLKVNSVERDIHLSTFSLSDLYEKFIYLHAKRFFVDKTKMQWSNIQEGQKERFVNDKLKGAEELACYLVIPEFFKYNVSDMSNIIPSLCDDLGIITNRNPPIFLHRTVAEYLAAKYIITKLNDDHIEESLNFVLMKLQFNVVRKFINSLLIGKDSKSFCKKENFNERRDFLENTPLHVASLEGNVEIIRFLLRRNQYLLNMKNDYERTSIHFACMKGKTAAVKLLLSHPDCSVNICDKYGNTLLHAAASSGCTEMIEMLLQRDYSLLNKQNIRGETPLHFLCCSGFTEATKLLLKHSDCSVNISANNGDTALHDASKGGCTETIEILLCRDRTLLNKQNRSKETPLHLACSNVKTDVVKLLLAQSDCSIHICDKDGNTVLHKASNNENHINTDIIEMILGCDISLLNIPNKKGKTPLHYACFHGHIEAVNLFLAHPDCIVDICDNNAFTVLHDASKGGCTKTIELLLQRGHSLINKQNIKMETPLHVACSQRRSEAAKLLLAQSDCSVNLCDKNGDTVLHKVPYKDLTEIIEIILQRNTLLINTQNIRGETPMHILCSRGKTNAAKLLLTHSTCAVNIIACNGNTILHCASSGGCTEVIETILQLDHGLLNKQNKRGETSLHFACFHGKNEAAKLLLTYSDCSVNMCCEDGDSVLHYASKGGCTEAIEIILRRDPDLLNMQNKSGETPLHLACSNYKIQAAKMLLKNYDCLVNICDEYGDTVLHAASAEGCTEIIEIILGRDNTSINKQNNRGETPLHCACKAKSFRTQTAKLLLTDPKCSVDICDKSENTVLHNATNGLTDIMEIILQRDNTLLNKINKFGKTPLHHACSNGKIRAVKLLLTHSDCVVNKSGNDGNTVLHIASSKGCTEIMENILLRDDSSLYKKNNRGETPLHCACLNGRTEAAKLLLSTYPNYPVNICDNDGNTVLHTTSLHGLTEIMAKILQRDIALLNKQNESGETPLHFASQNGKTEAVKLLLSYTDCSVNMLNENGLTALELASNKAYTDLIALFLQHSAQNMTIT